MGKNYFDIQEEVIKAYNIDICNGDKCENDWSRTHAHVKGRRVCKWKKANSIQSTFTLLHEIGHVETTKPKMKRADAEYYATIWAIEKCKEYGLDIPEKTISSYQDYIDEEVARGKRRGGKGYMESYKLPAVNSEKKETVIVEKEIVKTAPEKTRKFRTKTEKLCGLVRSDILNTAKTIIKSVSDNDAIIKEIEGPSKKDTVIRFVLIRTVDGSLFKEDIVINEIKEAFNEIRL